ncbi:MAG TPA: hypothetical protein VMK12_25820 [Anaeromyxobacteraceae bacterium]|nr:hypothetical protein [Anaeromyxobacteraceae bacterium]
MLFFDPSLPTPPSPDPEWAWFNAHPEAQELTEERWARFERNCPDTPAGFLGNARSHFRGAVWQMHVTDILSPLPGFEPGDREGPDLFIRFRGQRVAVECTAIGYSSTDYRHDPGRKSRSVGWGPARVEEIYARLADSLRTKQEQFGRWVKAGLVHAEDPFIVALSMGVLDWAQPRGEPPPLMGAVYAMGQVEFVLPIAGRGQPPIEPYVQRRQRLSAKKSAAGNPKDADLFMSRGEAGGISAVLFSEHYTDPFRRRDGREFELVHNAHALVPVAERALPCGREWARRGDFIEPLDPSATAA